MRSIITGIIYVKVSSMAMKYGYSGPILINAAVLLISFFWFTVVNREKVDPVEVLILFCIVCGLRGIFAIVLPVYFAKIQVKKVVCINRFSE
jgi:drug/metabolite transporter (DMT)-like permease